MDILVKAAQLILALVILVTVHEFGHYAFARMFGVKVNRFYLFFNPWFSILKWNPLKGTLELFPHNSKDGGPDKAVKTWQVSKPREPRADGRPTWRDTIYGLGWVPLGGYCDIAARKRAAELGIPLKAGVAASAGDGSRGLAQLCPRGSHLHRHRIPLGR